MNKLHQEIRKISSTMIFIAVILAGPQVLAKTTTLNGVEISSSNSRGYDIVLNTDNQTKIQKKSNEADTLVLDLKNTKVSKETNTIYKNADGIEHVILKPEANNLQIEINGKSAGNSNVSINNELAALPQNYNDTVYINKPLNAYAPIHEIEEETQSVSFIGLLKSIKNSQTLKSIINSSNIGWITCFLLMFGFLLKTQFKNQNRSQINVKIGNNTEDNNILKTALERREGLIAESLGSQRRTQLRPKPQYSTNIQKTNYGLKAYNNQPANASTNSFKIQNSPIKKDILKSATSNTYRQLRTTATTQELKEDIKKNEIHIDNVKFLESMAKIYERSGRVDLANGLANNIKKAKTIR